MGKSVRLMRRVTRLRLLCDGYGQKIERQAATIVRLRREYDLTMIDVREVMEGMADLQKRANLMERALRALPGGDLAANLILKELNDET